MAAPAQVVRNLAMVDQVTKTKVTKTKVTKTKVWAYSSLPLENIMAKKQHPQKKRRIKNPVARCMELVTRPATHKDKTKYNRKKDNKGSQGPFYLAAFSDKYFNDRLVYII